MFHFHRDPHWQQIGAWQYHKCKCGARRVVRAFYNIMGPVQKGWPAPLDSHGRFTGDSGWQK